MANRYLRKDGDFCTSDREKGWKVLPCSPANRYVYSNGWIVVGLRRLGFYATAGKGLTFIMKFQSKATGGFHSRFDISTRCINEIDQRAATVRERSITYRENRSLIRRRRTAR